MEIGALLFWITSNPSAGLEKIMYIIKNLTEKCYPKICQFQKMMYLCNAFGVLAHPVERNTGSVEVSSSSLLYSTE